MNELDIRILEVENGFTLEVNYTDNNGNYRVIHSFNHILPDVLHKINEIVTCEAYTLENKKD